MKEGPHSRVHRQLVLGGWRRAAKHLSVHADELVVPDLEIKTDTDTVRFVFTNASPAGGAPMHVTRMVGGATDADWRGADVIATETDHRDAPSAPPRRRVERTAGGNDNRVSVTLDVETRRALRAYAERHRVSESAAAANIIGIFFSTGGA